ncbi:hypothetical protein EJB05_12794, partial [Eragrostis curvula]
MAPSKRISLAFLLAFAVLAGAALHPSAAARDAAAVKQEEASPSAGWPNIPGLPPFPALPPLPSFPSWPRRPSFPCIPGWPRPQFLPPCNATHGGLPTPTPSPPTPAPPQPAECHTSLAAMATPCADFLTKTSVTAPPAACCDGLKAVVNDAPVCMCHVVNRDFASLLPAPMLRLRMMQLPRVCGAAMPFGTLRQCFRGPVPPMNPPKTPSP